MELKDYLEILKGKKQTIFAIVMIFFLLAFIVNIVQPMRYGTKFKVLIIQNNLNNADPFLVSKSSEHLGSVLSKVISSHSFYKKVAGSNFNIDNNYFGDNLADQTKEWTKTVRAINLEDSGILEINVYHTNRVQANQIAESIAFTLKKDHTEYHGSGDNVEIKILDEPLTSDFPVKPNVIVNLIIAILFGSMFSLVYIYVFPDEKYDLKVFPTRSEKASRKMEKISKKIKKLGIQEDEMIRGTVKSIIPEKEIQTNESDDDYGDYYDEEAMENGQEENGNNGDVIEIKEHEYKGDELDIDYEKITRGGSIRNILEK